MFSEQNQIVNDEGNHIAGDDLMEELRHGVIHDAFFKLRTAGVLVGAINEELGILRIRRGYTSDFIHGLGFVCVRNVLCDYDAAHSDEDLSLDVLHVVDLLAEGLRLAGLEVFSLEQALFAHALTVRLAESAGSTGLLGLGVDAFHRLMR